MFHAVNPQQFYPKHGDITDENVEVHSAWSDFMIMTVCVICHSLYPGYDRSIWFFCLILPLVAKGMLAIESEHKNMVQLFKFMVKV